MTQLKELFNSQLFLDGILQDTTNFNQEKISINPFLTKNETFQFFSKQIKLRNVIQKELWNRTRIQANNTYIIKVKDQLQNVDISSKVEQSIVNYLINNPNSDFIGRLHQSSSSLYDKIEPSEDNNNLFLNSWPFEEEKVNDNIHKLFNQIYMKISNSKIPLQTLFVYKKKEDKVIRKIWMIFPNINFELNQIINLTFSNTQLNKYLISKSNTEEDKEYKNGLLTLSQQNRLIALTEKNQKENHVIIGIWLNFKEENPNNDQKEINRLIIKYQSVIYQKCYEFIDKSSEIESVFSPNPDKGVFLLVIFYHGLQCQYEIKMNSHSFNEEKNNQIGVTSSIIENKWVIAKNNSIIGNNLSYNPDCCDIKNSHPIKMQYVPDFMNKMFIIDNRVSILTKSQVIKEEDNSSLTFPVHTPNKNNEKDTTDEQLRELLSNTYLDIDSFDDLYDYPLILPQQYRQNTQLNSQNQEITHKTNIVNQSKPSNLIIQQNKKQNEELYYSQASTNSYSNLLLSLKHSANTYTNCSINVLIQQITQKVIDQSNTLKSINSQISQVEAKAHLLLNRILMMKKHTKDTQIMQANTSIQVPHIRSVNLTSFNEEDSISLIK